MENNSYWRQFLIGVLGTAIGVGLTFFLSGISDNHKKAQAKRLTAIMVIHDIDNTIDMLKEMKEEEENEIKMLQAMLKRMEHLDSVPYDSLTQTINYLVSDENAFRFDQSKETIFNSDLDTWQNLGSMKFMDNVQSFFYQRQTLAEYLNLPDYFRKPVPREEYARILRGSGWVSREEFAALLRPFLQEKLSDEHVIYYINISNQRILTLNSFINSWSTLNEENKFLMGITDKELEDYIDKINNDGKAPGKASLVGHWERTMADGNYARYVFRRDNSYDYEMFHAEPWRAQYWQGRFGYTISYSGTWDLQADSIILKPDFSNVDVQIDTSDIEILESGHGDLSSWARQYREAILQSIENDGDKRASFKARLDSSGDKMQWTNDEQVRYLKRKE